jgi:propanol-preferring alcohol dehydrogenase
LAIIGIGGFGHMADQYAKAMGLRVAAADVPDEKLAFAERLGAEDVINARLGDPGVSPKEQTPIAAVTPVSPPLPLSSPLTYCALQASSALSACL